MKSAQRSLDLLVTKLPSPDGQVRVSTPVREQRKGVFVSELLLISIGSNLPDRAGRSSLESCDRAVLRLAAHSALTLESVSPWYRTAPIPASDQPDYINGAARFSGLLTPTDLLSILQAIEAEAGRIRDLPNAARTLDLDLLAVGDLVIDTPRLTLPHPRLADRAFVLFPLCDVAPTWRHPVLRRTAIELRDSLPPQRIEQLVP